MMEDPESVDPSRRQFLNRIVGGAAITTLTFDGVKAAFAQSVRPIADASKDWRVDEGYWEKIRQQFLLDEGFAYLNNGTLGPTPGPVYSAMVGYWRMMAEDPNEKSAILQGRMKMIREKVARFVGADPDEIAILRNTTEGNSLGCQGIDLKQGDEVLIGYLEHESVRQPWQLKAKRHGVVVKEVPIGTLKQWVDIKNQLGGVPSLKSVRLVSLTRNLAVLDISFLGDVPQFQRSLAQQDLSLATALGDPSKGTLRQDPNASVSQPPPPAPLPSQMNQPAVPQ